MLGDAQAYFYQAPRLAVYPGFTISLAALAFNLLGDRLRDALDPRTCADGATTARSHRPLGAIRRPDDGPIHAVDRLSFTLERGEVLGIVGESGCGKTATCLSLVRLLPETAVISGRVAFDGLDLLALTSPICDPTVKTGFSDVPGSWKTNEISGLDPAQLSGGERQQVEPVEGDAAADHGCLRK